MSSRWSTSIALVLLLAMLGIAALAYQAQYAARSHRTTAEKVLRDYAAFAAWEFSRNASRNLTNMLGSVIGQAMIGCRRGEAPDIARLRAQGG